MRAISKAFGRATGTLITTALLIVVLAIALQGAFQTHNSIAGTFERLSTIQKGQIELEELLRDQIDEENAIRGYALTRDDTYVVQYRTSAYIFQITIVEVHDALAAEHLQNGMIALDDYARLQHEWRARIAARILADPTAGSGELAKQNKNYADHEEQDARAIRAALQESADGLSQRSQHQLDSNLAQRAFWLAVLGLLAIVANGYRSRVSVELAEERTVTETLQRAFRSEHVPLPNSEVGSAYLSASSHLAVGGDVFDVYRLSGNLALILIADVSGKGIDAAVFTAFIKFTMRGIALRRRDPGAMLAEFNTAFAQTVENPYLFVSMLVGVLDTDTRQFRYASAGHDSAWIRRGDLVQQLAVTGPVLGVMEEPFDTKTIYLEEGDTIVLATDGLSEARTVAGEQLGERGAAGLIASSSRQPQLLADEIIAKVRALGGNKTRDDLAILVIRVGTAAGDAD